MAATELTARLADNFGPYIASDPSLLTESKSICTHYNVSPQDLYYNWEAFALNNALPKSEPFTVEHARELRKIIASSFNNQQASSTDLDSAATPLKPSSALNRGKYPGDLNAMLGIKNTPLKNGAVSSSNPFQTPSRPVSYSPFNTATTPGQTPANASAYRPTTRTKMEDTDVNMPDHSNDTPSRPAAAPSAPAFSIVESLNSHIPISGSGSQMCPPAPATAKKPNSRVALAMATDPKAWNYRYMFEKKGERSQVLDDRIDEFANVFREAYASLLSGEGTAGDESEDFGDPSLPSQDPTWVVGRICPALPAPHSSAGQMLRNKHSQTAGSDEFMLPGLPKLNETGVVLESSRVMGSGNRTPLVFAKGCVVRYSPKDVSTAGAATTLSLFPGQMVMCKGINAGTDKFLVSEICFPPSLPQAVHNPQDALDDSYARNKLNGQPINVLAAAGPFTHAENLDFEPWHTLMDHLEAGGVPVGSGTETERRGVPDTLILSGPFVSSAHPLLPFADRLPCDLFAHHFSARLSTLIAKYPAIMVVLIPSTLDILNIHAAYPQPGFNMKDDSLRLPKQRLRCLPNPSVFYINELVVGANTVDSLGDIKTEEMVTRIEAGPTSTLPLNKDSIAANNKETNTRWSRSLISQRSFYPVYPPPSSSTAGTALAYDTSHSHLLNFPAVTPDLLLLPSSKLAKPFIRVVNSTTVIQPGSLAPPAAKGAGTFVCFDILPFPKDKLEAVAAAAADGDGVQDLHADFWERARIDIVSM